MVRNSTGPCAALLLLLLLPLLPLLAAACPASPMSPPSPYGYGYEAMIGTGGAAYLSPFVAAPGAANAPAASPRAEKEPPVTPEAAPPAATAPAASPQAEEEPPVAPEAAPAAASPRAEEEPPVRDRDQEKLLMHQSGAGDGDHAQRLEHLARVLDILGYREMASSAPLLVSSPILKSWPGPWTVLAIPDAVLKAGCPAHACVRTHILMEHVALGGMVRANVAAEPYYTTKLSTAAIGKCITASASTNGPETLSVNGVEVSEPDLYNDGRLVIHGVKDVVRLPKRRSCSIGRSRSRRQRLALADRAEDILRDIFALAAA